MIAKGSNDDEGEEYEHTLDECLKEEEFIGNIVEERDVGQHKEEVVECPTCGRTYEFVFSMDGLWNPRQERYEWEA